jgi:hypothetical protein
LNAILEEPAKKYPKKSTDLDSNFLVSFTMNTVTRHWGNGICSGCGWPVQYIGLSYQRANKLTLLGIAVTDDMIRIHMKYAYGFLC